MVAVGKLSSFESSLVGKLLGYKEVLVHAYDERSNDKTSQKDEDILKQSNEKLSLFDSGTVWDKNNSKSFLNQFFEFQK